VFPINDQDVTKQGTVRLFAAVAYHHYQKKETSLTNLIYGLEDQGRLS